MDILFNMKPTGEPSVCPTDNTITRLARRLFALAAPDMLGWAGCPCGHGTGEMTHILPDGTRVSALARHLLEHHFDEVPVEEIINLRKVARACEVPEEEHRQPPKPAPAPEPEIFSRFSEKLSYIITHPGRAHHDDYLACAVLLAVYGDRPIYRRDPTLEELADPEIACVDVGMRHEFVLSNFDHHQGKRMPCAFHLVMMALGLHELACEILPWYSFTGDLDIMGPENSAEKYGFDRRLFDLFSSPFEKSIIGSFGNESAVPPEQRATCRSIGKGIIATLTNLSPRLAALDNPDNATIVELGGISGILSRMEERPSFGLDEFRASRRPDLLFSLNRDTRGEGWALYRWDGDPRVDFNRIRHDARLRFVHLDGFCAKTHELLPEEELLDLVRGAIDPIAGGSTDNAKGPAVALADVLAEIDRFGADAKGAITGSAGPAGSAWGQVVDAHLERLKGRLEQLLGSGA